MTAPTLTSTPRSTVTPARVEQGGLLARTLYRALLVAPPKRCATMRSSGDRKYSDAPARHLLSVEDLADHLAGVRTWATTLTSPGGQALAGCRDYDQGGEAVIVAALAAARAAGLVAFGILIPGAGTDDDHDGGHVWAFYDQPAPERDIVGQLATLPGARGEIYPSGNCIRLPFGLHRRKGIRGTLLLQDGRRFDLDQPGQFAPAIRAVLALRRNAAPPPAPVGQRASSGGSFGAAYDASAWEGITTDQGAALMSSPRYQLLFRTHQQLAALARGERVTLYRNGAPDDSDSAQVAALVWNLVRAHRRGRELGDGAPPESEIRAVALHWKPALRDGRSLAHYQAHVDSEIARHRPATYRPEATQYTSTRPAAAPAPLVESQTKRGRGRPTGTSPQRITRLDRLVELLIPEQVVRRCDLSAALGVGERQITKDLATLQATGHIELRTVARGLLVVRVERKIPAPGETEQQPTTASAGDVAARVEQKIPACEGGIYAAFEAAASGPFCLGETPPPPCPPAAGAVAPASPLAASNAGALLASDLTPAAQPQASQGSTGGPGVSPSPASASPARLRPQLAALVADAFDAAPGRRITLAFVRRYVRLQDGGAAFDDGAIVRTVAAERTRRRSARASAAFDQLRAKARAMAPAALKRASQGAASALVQAEKKRSPRAAFYRIRAGIFAAEEARRAALDEGEGQLLALADVALDELRAVRPVQRKRPAPRAPLVESSSGAEPTPESVPPWRALVTRLYALADARHHAEGSERAQVPALASTA